VSGALLKLKENKKIWYNHPQLAGTHKALMSLWTKRIQETQFKDKDLEDYANQEAIYISRNIAKEFVKEFYGNLTQRHNGATALVRRLEKEYVIYRVHTLTKQVIKKYPDYQRNKFTKHKPYRGL